MIRIIEDFDDILDVKNAVEVVDNDTYIQSRILISSLKEKRFKEDINIIVKKSKYGYGYYDLRYLKDFVEFEEINLLKTLEDKLDIELWGISCEDILSTKVNKKLQLFIDKYNYKYSYFQNVIMFSFEIYSMDFLNNVDDFVNFILRNIDIVEAMKNEQNKTLEYLKLEGKNISNRQEFLWFLGILDLENNVEDYVRTIIFNEIFRNYKEFERETIGKPRGHKDTCFSIDDEIIKEIFYKNINYIDELNLNLIKKEKQLYLFSSLNDEMFNKFIERFTGILRYEFDFAMKYIVDKISTLGFKDIEKLEAAIYGLAYKFQKLAEIDDEVNEIVFAMKNFINKVKILNSMVEETGGLNSIDEWADFYTDKYMIVKNDLDKENNIYEIIDRVVMDKKAKGKIKSNIDLILDSINEQYEEFLYKNFETVHIEEKGKYSISTALSKISYYSDEKIVFLVIDAMKWDIWDITKDILEEYEYVQENEDKFLVPMVPTVTSVSRLALFSGNKYKTIIEEKMKGVYDFDYRDEEKHFKRFFKDKKVGFAIGGKEKFNHLIDKDLDIYAFIYSESNAVLHGLTNLNKEIIYYILKEQLDNIIKKIEDKFEDRVRIIVTTDHGTIDIKNSKGIYIEKTVKNYLEKYSIDYSNHGKYIRVFSKEDVNEDIYDEIFDYFRKQNCFHIINRSDMGKFLLPKEENHEHNLFYLICKYNYHISNTTGSNTHGGLSMNETIIPFGVFEKKLENIKDLDITIFGELAYDTDSKLIVKIINPNDFEIKNAHLSIRPFVYDYRVDFIGKRDYSEFGINIIPKEQGLVNVNLSIEYDKFGEKIEIIQNTKIEVKKDLKTRISEDVKKSRRLDF